MNPRINPKRQQRQRRFRGVLWIVVGLSLAGVLLLQAFSENMMFYLSPSDVAQQRQAGQLNTQQTVRAGGLVVPGSVQRSADSLMVQFVVTDNVQVLTIHYQGILPDLFREGQGIIALGQLNEDGSLQASEVLAKHDETYMPPEVADSLKASSYTP